MAVSLRRILGAFGLTAVLIAINSFSAAGQMNGKPADKSATPVNAPEKTSYIDRVIVEYENGLGRPGAEGWVVLELVIGVDGSVEKATIVESHPKGVFDDAALKQVYKRKYEPVIIDGKPVRQTNREIVTFELQRSVSDKNRLQLRSKFKSQLDQANNALENGDFERASVIASEMEKTYAPSLYEQFYIAHLRANIANGRGDINEAILYTQRAIDMSASLLDIPARADLYKSLFALQIKAARIPEAMLTFEGLWQLGVVTNDDPYAQTYAMLKALMESNNPMVYTEEIQRTCFSCTSDESMGTHVLYRDTFKLELLSGDISRLEVSCEFGWQEYNFENGLEIYSDPTKGQCKVNIYGQKDSAYLLTETWADPSGHGAP